MGICGSARRRSSPTLIAAGFAAALLPKSAEAFELFGVHLWGEKKQETQDLVGEPVTYDLDLAVEGADNDVKDAVTGASNLQKNRDKAVSGTSGLLAIARADYRRILASLYTQGHYGGTISITFNGREADTLPPDADLPTTGNAIRVRVDPGPKYLFSSASIVNAAPPPVDEDDIVDDPAEAGFRQGEIARSGTVVKAGKLAVEAWRQQGHPKAELASRDVTADHPANALEAILTVEPGERAAYGDITVDGAARMDPQFVAWYTKLRPGAEFDPDDIKEAEKRLARLDVFQSVRVNEGETIGPGGLLPIVIAVEERKLRRIGVGATISTTDGFGAQAFWLHRNLFGRAEKLRFDAKVAGIGDTLNPGEFDYSLGATFQKPGVFTPDTDFSLAIAADRLDLESYRETSASLGTGFTHRFTDELSGRAFLRAKHARFEDDDGITDFTTLGLLAGVNYDSRDNAADATRGLFFDLEAEPFQEFQFGNTAVRAVAEARTYLGFGEKNRFVLAGRLKLGTITGAPVEELPNDKLFYAGGGGSVRGYAFRNIGVDQPDGTVDGGRSLIEGSVEARARFTDTIGAAAFVDFGYVGAETIPDFDENLRFGAGLGLRYYTSLGPIRLDVAAPLNPRPGDPSFSFYAGIGQAF